MVDPGFVPGFIGVAIQLAIHRILRHITIAVRCTEELSALKDVVIRIEPVIRDIHQYRLEVNRKRGISPSHAHNNVSAVNVWLEKLNALLLQASQMAQHCTISSSFNIISRYKTSIRIANLKSDIDKHLESVPLIQLALTHEVLLEQFTQRERVQASASSSASTSMPAIDPTAGFFIEEPLIVGQEKAFAILQRFVVDAEPDQGNSLFRIGVVGMGGAGKTLLLKRVFSNEKVRDLFRDGLLLWLTVSNDPSFTNLRNELCNQIAVLTRIDFDRNRGDEYAKSWLNRRLHTHRFALFLDDVWRDGPKLMEELGLHLIGCSDSKVIVSSRDRTVLSGIGAADRSIISMGDLAEEDSWQLFAIHAFPHNNGNLPANIDERTAKVVCDSCGGLPLAIKVIGRAMASTTQPRQWEMAAKRLSVTESHEEKSQMYDRLRLSYDALGNYSVHLQLCFLYAAAAYVEDQIVHVEGMVIPLWSGEGLLARKNNPQDALDDPFEMGRIYVDLLADRCLIEPTMRDIDGSVLCFRIHDVLRNLGIQIAEREESFFCGVGTGLTALPENECSVRTRIVLNANELSCLPESYRGPDICSLLMYGNTNVTKIPKQVIGSMYSLKVLDLSMTSLSSLPNSVGGLKQLVCLRLVGVPIRRLPPSLVNLVNLEILDLRRSSIMELPSDLHKLRSLRYLSLRNCTDLQYLPWNISRLTSLQHLDMYGCSRLWTKLEAKKRCKKVASIHNLGSLGHLKKLVLENNGERVEEGTLGNMVQMETLKLKFERMASLPQDMASMIKLKTLILECPSLIKMESRFFEFQNMSCLILYGCLMLEELPYLYNLRSLRELEVSKCYKIKKFSKELCEAGAFPLLEIFSLVWLPELEELPFVYEGAMSSLKIFTMMECEALKMLPESYLTIKTLQKVRVFGCSMVLENLDRVDIGNKKVEMITMSTMNTREMYKRYMKVSHTKEGWVYGKLWCNEFFLFLHNYFMRSL